MVESHAVPLSAAGEAKAMPGIIVQQRHQIHLMRERGINGDVERLIRREQRSQQSTQGGRTPPCRVCGCRQLQTMNDAAPQFCFVLLQKNITEYQL